MAMHIVSKSGEGSPGIGDETEAAEGVSTRPKVTQKASALSKKDVTAEPGSRKRKSQITGTNGVIEIRNAEGQLHSSRGPAVMHSSGLVEYWRNDQLHNVNGPAVERPDGSYEFRMYGQLHNLKGPALETSDGRREHWVWGQLHNEEGPAITWQNGDYMHYVDGLLHALTKPAVQRNGVTEYRVNGQLHSNVEPARTARNDEGNIVRIEHWKHGVRHNEEGPAYILFDGEEIERTEYWQDGYRHRLGAPSVISSTGKKEYYLHGLRHNLDGPAIVEPGKKPQYFVMGFELPAHPNETISRIHQLTHKRDRNRRSLQWVTQAIQARHALSALEIREALKASSSEIEDVTFHAGAGYVSQEGEPAIERKIAPKPPIRENAEQGVVGQNAFAVTEWRLDGKLHSPSEEATVSYSNGMTSQWQNGKFVSATCPTCDSRCVAPILEGGQL